MREREAQWHTAAGATAMLEKEAHNGMARSDFLQMSAVQVQLLKEHQRSAAAVTTGIVGQSALRHQERGRHGLPTTGLRELNSEFVGPIGVGTMAEPVGCATKVNASLLYMPKRSGSFLKSTQCRTMDASQVWVVFDTGSTNLWLASDLCTSNPCKLKGLAKFDHTKSISYVPPVEKENIEINFGSASISGFQAIEDFHVGPFTISNQTFGMIEEEEGLVFAERFGGILGLAFPEMAANDHRPFFDSVMQQNVLPSNEFTFYFSRDNPAANAILWGGVDPNFHEGELLYFNVTDRYYWSLDLKGLYMGDEQLLDSSESWKAVVDTGTTWLSAEGTLYDDIMGRMAAISCEKITKDTHPDITFELETSEGELSNFTLTHKDYMTPSRILCLPAFMHLPLPKAHGPGVILGEIFVRLFLTNFRRGDRVDGPAQIGFARAKHGQAVEEHLRGLTKDQPLWPGLLDEEGEARWAGSAL